MHSGKWVKMLKELGLIPGRVSDRAHAPKGPPLPPLGAWVEGVNVVKVVKVGRPKAVSYEYLYSRKNKREKITGDQ